MITSFFRPKASKTKASAKRQSLDTVASDEASEASLSNRNENENQNQDENGNPTRKRAKTEDAVTTSTATAAASNGASNATSIVVKVSTPQVEELLSSLNEPGWKGALQTSVDSPSFARLAKFVAQERRSHTVFPPLPQVWTSLNECTLDKVKVVILGQDPYHGPNQAHGLSFSVPPGQAMPPSLKNIFLELQQDPNIDNFSSRPSHGHLIRWAQQGVLMLNTVLTVRQGQANSHQKKGWEAVTSAILKTLKGRKCVFLVWGRPAAQRMEALHATSPANKKNHVVISTSHPSPLGARKTKSPFLGSRCFSRCNESLREMELEPIDWKVDGPLP